jgi:hypothetical protein
MRPKAGHEGTSQGIIILYLDYVFLNTRVRFQAKVKSTPYCVARVVSTLTGASSPDPKSLLSALVKASAAH